MQNQQQLVVTILGMIAALSAIGYHFQDLSPTTLTTEVSKYQAWKNWLQTYGKVYSYEELPLKYSTFSANYDLVQQHNSEDHSYKLGMNIFADLTSAEFASYRMHIKFEDGLSNTKSVAAKDSVPSELNWNTKGAVGPVNNQGQCGSCWAFSATEAIEGVYELTKGTYKQFSVQQIVDCSEYTGAQGCNGGYPQWAYEYVQKYGIEALSDYPYTGTTDTCKYNAADVVTKITGYVNVTANSPTDMTNALQTQPLSVCIEADSYSFQLYSSGIYDDAGCGTTLDHCVLLDGYNTSGSKPYWIVQNSWGTSWGQAGYIWIQQSSGKGICGINTWVTYPTM